MKTISYFLTLCIYFCTVISHSVYGQGGTLDNTFGTGGKVTTSFGNVDVAANAVAIQSDGKIVVAGYTGNFASDITDFAVARYNSNGTLDTSFSSDGEVTTDFGTTKDRANSVVIQTDGKIVVGGYWDNSSVARFAMARYNTDGSLDTLFGTDGKVITAFVGPYAYGYSLALQNDGKIVFAGRSSPDFALARYNVDGSLDSSFGSGGMITTPIGNIDDEANSVAIQSDGKIILGGYSHTSSTDDDFALSRYNSDGSLDNTFGSGGILTTSFGNTQDDVYSVGIQSDGKIVAGGYIETSNGTDFALARYNSDGSLDIGFGSNGKVTTNLTQVDAGLSVAIQNNTILLGGTTYNNSSLLNTSVVHYNNNGNLDNTFGVGGVATAVFGNTDDRGTALALQSDEKIILAGYRWNGSYYNICIARFSAAVVGIDEVKSINSILIFPNPASGNSFINYTLSTPATVSIALYDVLGNKLQQVINGNQQQGEHNATIDARKLANGVYVLQIRAGEQVAEEKVVLLR